MDNYIRKLKENPNLTYSSENSYFIDFEKTDALIQDCCSFLVEYFYTQKPQCYMLENPENISKYFSELGSECLSRCYLAYKEKDITDFIDRVVIKKDDPLQSERIRYANEEIMLNYPKVAQKIKEDILNTVERS